MSQQPAATAVRHSVVVDAPIEKAFRVFTEDFGRFKPPEHNMLGVGDRRDGLRASCRGPYLRPGVDGSECRWARVLAYEPPHRVIISWDIGPDLADRVRSGQDQRGRGALHRRRPERTRVELEHRHLDRHGEGWQGVRDGVTATRAGRCTCTLRRPFDATS